MKKIEIGISVIVPVYNEEKFLDKFFDTLLCQTYKNFEVICIDDGSTDNTLKILKKYEMRDERVFVYSQTNKHAGVARNMGLGLANGRYVIFLDADDFFAKDMLEKTFYHMENVGADICCFGVYDYNNITQEKKENIYQNNSAYYPVEEKVFSPLAIPEKIFSFTSPAPWNKLYRKSFIDKYNLKFQPIHSSNDCFFVMSAFALADKITCLRDCLIYYRINVATSLQANRDKEPLLFIEPLVGIKEILTKYKKIDLFEVGYANFALAYSMWNIQSVNLDKKSLEKLYRYLKECAGKDLSLDVLTDDNILDKNKHYLKEYRILMSSHFDEYLDRSALLKGKLNPKVSVIVPVYNVEKYLPQCMDSLVSQTLKEMEIICVNDGSKDSSLAILKDYARKDKRIKIIDKANAGYGQTMNVGLNASSGKYIGIVESDDWVEPDMFEKLYTAAEKNNFPDLIKSDAFIKESEDGSMTVRLWGDKVVYNKDFDMGDHGNLVLATPATWTAIYKRDTFINNNLRWNETPGASFQDTSFSIMMIMFSKRAYVMPQSFYHYRVDRPTSSRNTSNKGYCIFDEFNYVESLFVGREEMRKKYWPILQVAKYMRCQWCANLVMDKKKFWEQVGKDFLRASKGGFMEKALWNTSDWHKVQKLISDVGELEAKCEEKEVPGQLASDYIFPYHLTKPGQKVLIYGAGDVGQAMWEMITNDRLVVPVALVARNSDKTVPNGCRKAGDMLLMQFDCVIISEPQIDEAKKAKQELLEYGIRQDRIKWDGEVYARSVFMKRYFYPMLDSVVI